MVGANEPEKVLAGRGPPEGRVGTGRDRRADREPARGATQRRARATKGGSDAGFVRATVEQLPGLQRWTARRELVVPPGPFASRGFRCGRGARYMAMACPIIQPVGTGPQNLLSSESPRLSPIMNQRPAGISRSCCAPTRGWPARPIVAVKPTGWPSSRRPTYSAAPTHSKSVGLGQQAIDEDSGRPC
jgi:hypothetical protein